MESLPVVVVVVTLCAVVYTVYMHTQEVAAMENRLLQLESTRPLAPHKRRKTEETPVMLSKPQPAIEEKVVEYCERGMETDPLPEEVRKRPREEPNRDNEEIRRRVIGTNGKNRQDKAAAYLSANFQRSKERFLASVADTAKRTPPPESAPAKFESPKVGKTDTLTYTSPSEVKSAPRREEEPQLIPAKPEEKKPSMGNLFGSTPPPSSGSLFASVAPATTTTAAEPAPPKPKPASEASTQPTSLFGAASSASTPPPASTGSLFGAPVTSTPPQSNPTPVASATNPVQPSVSPGSSNPTAPTLFGSLGTGVSSSLFGSGPAAPKPPGLFQAPPPSSQPANLFGAPAEKPPEPKSLFPATPATEAPKTLFGLNPASEPAQSNLPSAANTVKPPAPTSGQSLFGQFGSDAKVSILPSQPSTSLFGSATPSSSGSLFGAPGLVNSGSLFSTAKPKEGAATSSLFGPLPAGFMTPTSGSLFEMPGASSTSNPKT